jgi:hypothetical protein
MSKVTFFINLAKDITWTLKFEFQHSKNIRQEGNSKPLSSAMEQRNHSTATAVTQLAERRLTHTQLQQQGGRLPGPAQFGREEGIEGNMDTRCS